MDMMGLLASAQGGKAMENLAARFGLDSSQVTTALSQFAPSLTSSVMQKAALNGGFSSLLAQLSSPTAERYADGASVPEEEAVSAGNGILGTLLGNGGERDRLVNQASAASGAAPGVIQQLLPMAVTMLVGVLSKRGVGGASAGGGLFGLADDLLGGLFRK